MGACANSQLVEAWAMSSKIWAVELSAAREVGRAKAEVILTPIDWVHEHRAQSIKLLYAYMLSFVSLDNYCNSQSDGPQAFRDAASHACCSVDSFLAPGCQYAIRPPCPRE